MSESIGSQVCSSDRGEGYINRNRSIRKTDSDGEDGEGGEDSEGSEGGEGGENGEQRRRARAVLGDSSPEWKG
ncbi:hypothetical protein [Natrialba hulunbeirensis]|uniref:hypothetical protein n=1 Tax=Natrialba hulunbeirensis TaxID=123783 RepID=UPI001268A866|nr:hypothetical protein [Natrialba hulunbeirensis]